MRKREFSLIPNVPAYVNVTRLRAYCRSYGHKTKQASVYRANRRRLENLSRIRRSSFNRFISEK